MFVRWELGYPLAMFMTQIDVDEECPSMPPSKQLKNRTERALQPQAEVPG